MNKYINQIILHGIFWITIFIMISLLILTNSPWFVQFRQFYLEFRYIGLLTFLIGLIAFYLSYFVVKIYRKRGRPYLKNIVVIVITLGLTVLYLCLILTRFPEGNRHLIMATGPRPLLAIIPVTFFSVMGIIFQGYQYSTEQKEKEQQLVSEKLDLELLVIKNQLNPHFLFNTLNNIDNFIKKDPEKASDAVIKLSSILRYQLYESDRDKVLLEQDIKIIEDYLSLQKMRYGDHAVVNFKKVTEDKNLMIAPGVFIPYIENAFKHSPVNRRKTAIEIELAASKGSITFSIKNEKKANENISTNADLKGMGLELARKKLEIIYPESYQLDIFDKETEYLVNLTITPVGV